MSAFSKLAKESNTLLLPANTGDITNMVAQVSVVSRTPSLALGEVKVAAWRGLALFPPPSPPPPIALSFPPGSGHLHHADQAASHKDRGRHAPSP